MLGEQKVNGLALLIDRTIEIAPLALHLDVCLVHPPAHPHGTLAPMKRLLELGAIFDDPSVNGGVIHLHPPFLHEFFDMARAQRVRHIPADPHQNNLWGEMGTFEIDRHPSLSLMIHGCSERRMIPQNASNKNCDKTEKTDGTRGRRRGAHCGRTVLLPGRLISPPTGATYPCTTT